ncbi:beta-defensin 113 [Cervus elaphus]|uniref:beta-defensin 113 n=1 Tax=Cervus canadensis TaxID=1574408 RepID=UPI001CA31803|nr:beta-defensin 113 [Cervus canadensis]XP_043762857.1 beta-defensin 113 [Cervus elaphus]
MKILCIFLTFILTVSCGPAVLQRKTREKIKEVEERKRQCYLVRGACKTSCGQWEYKYTDCSLEPCCVAREYSKGVSRVLSKKKQDGGRVGGREYTSLHGYIRNTPSDTEGHGEHQLRAYQST